MAKRSLSDRNDSQSAPPSKKQRLAPAPSSSICEYFDHSFLSERDLQHEEDVKLHPYYLKNWQFYIQTKQEEIDDIEAIQERHSRLASQSTREQFESDRARLVRIKFLLYERALQHLPGSYKLWHAYLSERIALCRLRCLTDPVMAETNHCFERCLALLHKMPRLWMMYAELLTFQRLLTRTRHVFDRMLKALPITQHDRVWPLYLKFVRIAQVCLEHPCPNQIALRLWLMLRCPRWRCACTAATCSCTRSSWRSSSTI